MLRPLQGAFLTMIPISSLLPPDDLRRRIGNEDLVILDASVAKTSDEQGRRQWISGRAAFEQAHLPGARYADLIGAFSEPDAAFPFTRASPMRFAAAAERLGIGPDSNVAIYDRTNGIWAARLWWQFRAMGHSRVGVVDGGFAAWTASGGNVEVGDAPPAALPRSFAPRENPAFWADLDDVRAIMEGKRPGTLACALRPPVFSGAEVNYGRAGHIPISLNLPHGDLIEASGAYLSGEALRGALRSLLSAHGPIVVYCGGGVAACGVALALTLAGRDDVAVYDGSLSEWAADPKLPMTSLES
jgi:thiosulfate/3-mercaptopyruvate sulfurtransferase